MTREEYKKIEENDFLLKFGFPKWKHYNEARKRFKPIILEMKSKRPGVNIVLHHHTPESKKNYELWDTIPMYTDEHTALHKTELKIITNGIENKQILKNEPIPEGWVNGFSHKKDLASFKKHKILDISYKEKISNSMKGKKRWRNTISGKCCYSFECPGENWIKFFASNQFKKSEQDKEFSKFQERAYVKLPSGTMVKTLLRNVPENSKILRKVR